MSVKEFDKLFGLSTSIEEEKTRFINRVENTIFNEFEKAYYEINEYSKLFRNVCYYLGEDAEERIRQNSFLHINVPELKTLTEKDFHKTLRVLIALYESCSDKPNNQKYISNSINKAIDYCNLNIGIKWADGIFYPSGDTLLDKELIETSVSLLEEFPNEKIDLKNALDNYYAQSLYGVIENCYICIEGISRKILNNRRTLDKNKEDLLRLLHFSSYWDKIFLNYLKYAHEYRRHAGEDRHNLKPEEVEGFLYLTCLIIRATIKSFNANNN